MTMKKTIIVIITCVCIAASANAQQGSGRLSLGNRATLQERHGYNARLRTRNELSPYVGVLRQRLSTMGRVRFVRAYLPGIILAKLNRSYGFGVAYKPCMTRGRNHYGESAYRSFSRKRHE